MSNTQSIINIMNEVINLPEVQTQNNFINPSTYIDRTEVGLSSFGSANVPELTSASLQHLQTTSSGLISVNSSLSSNISNLGASMAVASGNWVVSMSISTLDFSHMESHSLGESLDISVAVTLGEQLAEQRALLLGCAGTLGNQQKSRGTPVIDYIRWHDPINPRITTFRNYTRFPWTGYPKVAGQDYNSAADFGSVGVTTNLSAVNPIAPNPIQRVPLYIMGQPDLCCSEGSYNGSNVLLNATRSFDSQLRSYIAYLGSVASKCGVMTQSLLHPKKAATEFTLLTNGQYSVKVINHGWLDNAKVRISSAKPSAWNGVYKIAKIDDDHIKFQTRFAANQGLPLTAQVQQIVTGAGVRCVQFSKFTTDFTPFRLTSRKPARPLQLISFKRRKPR